MFSDKSKKKLDVEPAIDFSELSSGQPGEKLEQLTRILAKNMHLTTEWSGRCADEGKDLIVIEDFEGKVSSHKIKWLVSCKDNYKSNKSVNENDAGSINDKVEQHKADGFLLVTTTIPSTGLKRLLDSLDKANGGKIYTAVWDSATLTYYLLDEANENVLKSFFPNSFKRYRNYSPEEALGVLKSTIPKYLFRILSKHTSFSTELSGSSIAPNDKAASKKIDKIMEEALEKGDIISAVELCENLDLDLLMDVVKIFSQENILRSELFLIRAIQTYSDSEKVLNLIQFYIENNDVPEATITLAVEYLDRQYLRTVLEDRISEWLNIELTSNGPSYYSFWSDIQELSKNSVVEDIYIDDIEFVSVKGEDISFHGIISISLALQYGNQKKLDSFSKSFPGTFKGIMRDTGWELDEILIDTSSFDK